MNKSWRWCGHAHHFIDANHCQFHLATWVGNYLVSTVGDWWPHPGDERHALGPEPDLFFETMVFPASLGHDSDYSCHGYAVDSWAEVDVWRYQTTEAANEGHLRACLTWGQR